MSRRQTICVHIGQAGVQLGSAIWELIGLEHGVKINGSIASQYNKCDNQRSSQTFFYPNGYRRYAPRCLFVDTESMVIDEIRTGPYKKFFPSKTLISGFEDAANIFSRGFNMAGKCVINPTLEALRLLCEVSDNIHGVLIFKSCGGGTGSGTTNLFLNEIEGEFPKINFSEFAIIPAPCISTSIVEAYNTVLTVFQTMRHINIGMILDNQALYDISKANLAIENPCYVNINRIVAQIISSVTASLRFESVLSSDFNIFQTNLIPFPRLKYPVISYAPIISSCCKAPEPNNVFVLTEEVFQNKNFTVKCFPEYGEYMACAVLYRGKNCGAADISEAIARVKNNSVVKFVDWSPTGFKVCINRQPPPYIQYSCLKKLSRSVCLIANSTCISQIFDYLIQKFDVLYQRKAYVHWFTGEGLEEAEFCEARQGICNVLMDYIQNGKFAKE